MLQESLLSWIERAVPTKGTNYESTLPAVISTDIGIARKENQDRAVVMRFLVNGRTQTIFALADGMGGMRDGGHCASLALAGFLKSYATSSEHDTYSRLKASALYANEAVFSYSQGNGGATLSAIAVNHVEDSFHSVNVGDSRAFAFNSERVDRLTVDDSLAEAVGGHSRELIQFVGMGAGMQPHVRSSSGLNTNFLITSDGVHFVEPEIFETIISRAPTIRATADRLMALARWCGGPDNATLIAAHVPDVRTTTVMEGILQFWDAFSMLQVIYSKQDAPPLASKAATSLALRDNPVNLRGGDAKVGIKAKKPRRKSKVEQQEVVQFSIDVEGPRKEDEKNADR